MTESDLSAREHGRTAMTDPRYQLWMRLMFHHPGYHPTEGRAQFAWTILDTQQPDHKIRRLRAQEYGYVLAGGSDVQGEYIETMLQYGTSHGGPKTLETRIAKAIEILEAADQMPITYEDEDEVSFVIESQVAAAAVEVLQGEEDEDEQ